MKRGHFIPTILYKCHPSRTNPDNHDPFTIIYSHGNAVDLHDMQYALGQIADSLGCNVFSYEFVGYGPSLGPVSEENCYDSLMTAYHELRSHHLVPANRIILWGRSLGSGPTVDVAAQLGREIAGIILESPLRSIIRTIIPYNFRTCCCDVFANQDKIQRIQVPVHIEHGTADIVVPQSHGVWLHEKLGALSWEPRWWPGLGHNNLPRPWMAGTVEGSRAMQGCRGDMTVDDMHAEQFRTIRDFILYLRHQHPQANGGLGSNTSGIISPTLPWPPTPTSQLTPAAAAAEYIAVPIVVPPAFATLEASLVAATTKSLPASTPGHSNGIGSRESAVLSGSSVAEREPLTGSGLGATNGLTSSRLSEVELPTIPPGSTSSRTSNGKLHIDDIEMKVSASMVSPTDVLTVS